MAAAAIAAGLVTSSASQAATWDGDVSQTANVAANWANDVLPPAGDAILFSNIGGGTITYNLSGSQNPSNVTFDATAAAFTLTNDTTIQLTTAAGVANNSAFTQTVQTLTQGFGLATTGTFTHNLSGQGANLNMSALGFRPDGTAAATIIVFGLTGNVGGTVGGAVTDAATFTAAARRTISKSGTGTWNLNGNLTYNSSAVATSLNTASALAVSGGTLNVSGTNTFRGTTNIAGGTLVVKSNSALGGTTEGTQITGGNANSTLILDGTAGDLTVAEPIYDFQLSSSGGNGVAVALTGGLRNAVGNNTMTGAITTSTGGSLANIESAAGTLTLTGTINTVGGANRLTRLSGAGNGTIGVAGDNTKGLMTNSGSTTADAGQIIEKTGSGTWTVQNTAIARTGATTLTEGVLEVKKLADGGTGLAASANTSSIGVSTAAAANLQFQGGTLRYTGTGDSTNRLFSINQRGGTIDSSGAGALKFTGTGAVTNPSLTSYAATFPTGSNVIAVNNIGGQLSVGMTVSGTGIQPGTTITAVNIATGLATISQPTTAASANTAPTLAFTGAEAIDRTLTLTGTAAATNVLTPALSNPTGTARLAVSKTGSTAWTLAGANSYTGGTTVSGGTLITANNAALGNGLVSVTGGTLQVGDGTTNTVGGITGLGVTSGSTLAFAANTLTPEITLASGVFNVDNAVLNLNNLFNAAGTYTLIDGVDGANAITGTTSFQNVDTSTYSYAFAVSGNDGVLTVSTVPEPASLAVLGLGGLVMLRRRRA